MKENSKYRLCDDRDEIVNNIIGEENKGIQEQAYLGQKDDPQGTMQETEIWH